MAAARRKRKDPDWEKACDEVTAAFASAHLRARHRMPARGVIAKYVREFCLPRAIELFVTHSHEDGSCLCRHYSLIEADAEKVAKKTGSDAQFLANNGRRIVDLYLSMRS